jgi:regulatory protein
VVCGKKNIQSKPVFIRGNVSDNLSYAYTEKAALRLVARAEQCSANLARKLEKRGHETACISEVISQLTGQNLLNDSRFARLWLQSRLRFARSPRRLLSSLCARGINHDDAQTALDEVLDEETELSILIRFTRKCKHKTGELKFLLKSEGFSAAVIQKYIEKT